MEENLKEYFKNGELNKFGLEKVITEIYNSVVNLPILKDRIYFIGDENLFYIGVDLERKFRESGYDIEVVYTNKDINLMCGDKNYIVELNKRSLEKYFLK